MNITFESVYEMLKKSMKMRGADGAVTGQEERDHAFGLLFGLQSFVQANILFQHEGRWESVLDDLLELADQKKVMREQCGWAIVTAFDQMNQTQAELTLEKVRKAGLATTPEGVGIWLAARKQFPDMRFPSKPWGRSGNPLEHLKTLAKALKENSTANSKDTEAKPTGSWSPNLHFAWIAVLNQYIEAAGSRDKEDIFEGFKNFWKVAVDGMW